MGSTFKLNFDALVFANTNSSGFNVIIRNNIGQVMAGLLARGPYVASNEEAEVLTFRKALELAIDAGFMELVVEGDNATVMKSLLSPQVNRSRLGHIYKDVQTLAARFRRLSVGCIKLGANSVALSLALYAGQLDDEILWPEESPPPTLDALYLDSISLNE